jgi:ribosomal protein L12E/L44/L45/RPP1/RPP2
LKRFPFPSQSLPPRRALAVPSASDEEERRKKKEEEEEEEEEAIFCTQHYFCLFTKLGPSLFLA